MEDRSKVYTALSQHKPFLSINQNCHIKVTPFAKENSRFFIIIWLGGIRVEALLDTGSTHSDVNANLVERLIKKSVLFHKINTCVLLADESTKMIDHFATIPINLNKCLLTTIGKFYSMENSAFPVILGMDVMRALKLIIDLDLGSVYVRSGNRKTFLDYQHICLLRQVTPRVLSEQPATTISEIFPEPPKENLNQLNKDLN